MNHRHVNKQTCNFSYNAENYLSGVAQVSFDYNGDGQRVVATEGITTTVFVGNCFKWQIVDHGTYTSTQITKYYYADGTRVAMQRGGEGTKYLLGDHLGSASVVLNADGTQLGAQGYRPWGAVNFTEGTIPTEYTFTGQFSDSYIKLLWYNSRWLDPELGRFTQPDTILPESQGVQAYDRYAYANNNALKYTDPGGHEICDADGQCGIPLSDEDDWLEYWTNMYRIRFGGEKKWTPAQKRAVIHAVRMVGLLLSNPSLGITSFMAFTTIYGSLLFEKINKYTGDETWGKAENYNNIHLFNNVSWSSQFITQFLVHEMGHAFAISMRDRFSEGQDEDPPYGALDEEYDNNDQFPSRPDGYAGGHGSWQWSDQETPNEEFADMFVGWVFGQWASNDAGTTRSNWMTVNMAIWLGWVYY
jgi:RHS repeat-associated protein